MTITKTINEDLIQENEVVKVKPMTLWDKIITILIIVAMVLAIYVLEEMIK